MAGKTNWKKKHDELLDDLRRVQAEFENYRKRIERDTEQARTRATEGIVKDILPVLDNLSLAIEHARSDPDELSKGILMVRDQLTNLLEDRGLAQIPAKDRFDPSLHEAITTVQDGKRENNTIVKTFQAGYTLGGKVVRPAKVSIVRNKED